MGGDGNDLLNDEAGADTLEGGAGNDTMYGYQEADVFIFRSGSGVDYLEFSPGSRDAERGGDVLRIERNINGTDIDTLEELLAHASASTFKINAPFGVVEFPATYIDLGDGNGILFEIRFSDLNLSGAVEFF
ncbi:MAG TPA: hypothetical protein VGE72_08505 [Azospirillum sp.]